MYLFIIGLRNNNEEEDNVFRSKIFFFWVIERIIFLYDDDGGRKMSQEYIFLSIPILFTHIHTHTFIYTVMLKKNCLSAQSVGRLFRLVDRVYSHSLIRFGAILLYMSCQSTLFYRVDCCCVRDSTNKFIS